MSLFFTSLPRAVLLYFTMSMFYYITELLENGLKFVRPKPNETMIIRIVV